jgi:hypothetical protein
LISINSTIIERKIDSSPLLILFRMLFIDGQLKCLEEKPDDSNVFVEFCKLVFKVFLIFLLGESLKNYVPFLLLMVWKLHGIFLNFLEKGH